MHIKKRDERDHVVTGMGHTIQTCLVCDRENPTLAWTDYNGQVYCHDCGCTYQILSCKFTEETLSKWGLTESQIKVPYCDAYEIVDLLRWHWQETHQPFPLGCWLGRSPYTDKDYGAAGRWLENHADELKDEFADEFEWDRIIERRDKRVVVACTNADLELLD